MKRKLILLLFALALLLRVGVTPVYAGEDGSGEDDPPPCSQCDGGQIWSG